MLKDIKLPEPLLEFIESTKQRLLAEVGTTHVDHDIKLRWTGTVSPMVSPDNTYITFYVSGFGGEDWRKRCWDIEGGLDYEFLFDCVPGPFVIIECHSKRRA